MSQEKVNQKKELKTKRKSIVRKKKIEYGITMAILVIVAVAIIGWVGYSVYTKVTDEPATEASSEDYNAQIADLVQNALDEANQATAEDADAEAAEEAPAEDAE